MTLPAPPPDDPIRDDTPGRQDAGLSATLRNPARLTALRRLALLDSPAEQAFDRLTRLAAKILHTPVALLSLVDEDRSFFKSNVGLPKLWASRREMPVSYSVCQHVVATNAPVVINDAREHPLVIDNEAVAQLRIVAYLGIPLTTSEGHALGTFAVIDTVPREWAPEDVTTLGDLAASAMTEIELRAETNLRLQVEQRLQLLESVVGNASAAVLIAEADPGEPTDPRIVFVNDAYSRLTGYSLDEVVGKSHQVLNSSETDRTQVDTIRTALATWKPARLNVLSLRKDGSKFWAELNIVPIADKAGRYSHWVVIQRDISEQKAAEEALQRSTAEVRRMALIAQRTDNAVILTDPQGRIEWVNEGFTRITEFGLEDVLGKTPGSVLQGPDTDPATVTHMRKRLRQGQGFQVEILNYAKSGRPYWLAIEVQPIHDDQGNLTQFMAIESDITERKWAQEMLKSAQEMLKRSNKELEVRVAQRTAELSEANEFMKALLENVQDAIVACNSEGVLTLFNRITREFHGLPEQPIRPDQWAAHYRLYRADGQTLMTTDEIPLIRALRGERIRNVEMVIVSKEGAARTLLASGQAFFDGQGNKLGAVVSMKDVTERKQAELELLRVHDELEQRVEARTEELAQAKLAAETANRAKSEFFSRMSHELRTPLNVILGFGQLLEMDTLTGKQRECAEQVVKGGRHLLSLINEVLDIARIEARGADALSPEVVDVGEVVEDVLGMIQPLADQARLRVLPPQHGICDRAVFADLQRLKQVLLNLLSNAIKYNRPGGTVAVACGEAGAMLRISVADTGPGIPTEKMHRLFAPFDRLEAEQKGEEGTGLGLTLSRGLVEAMRGTMGVESTVGKGSTFWFELPRIGKTSEPAGKNPATVAASEETLAMAGTVLYVEDNPASFRLVERIFERRPGLRLLSATQGQLGLDLARVHLPDVIFLDLHLPDLPGDAVLRRLRDDAATRDTPVIIVSADATPRHVERLLAAGASHYLIKPVQVQELLHLLGETLSKRGR